MKLISILTNGVAVLCGAGIPIWILGVPGTEGNYAKGWKVGLQVIFAYPIFILVLRGGGLIASHLSSAHSAPAAKWENGAALAALLVAVGRLVQSFKTID